MTDDDADDPAVGDGSGNTGPATTAHERADRGGSVDDPVASLDPRRAVLGVSLAVLVLVGVAAAWGLYESVGRAISVWVAPRYEAVVRAGFNLTLLLAVAAGVSFVLSELGGSASGGD